MSRSDTDSSSKDRRRYDFGVGSQGIRRRKPVRQLPKITEELSPIEQERAFGNFRWSQFSPAGSLERTLFVIRQAKRRHDHPEWPEFDPVIRRIGWTLIFGMYATMAVLAIFALSKGL